ncbi:nickel ABC transporter permease subunit NikC [Halalkalibacterium halodurans]|nr:nickel ABC transporter permease subunit NikC [Halalkalibacterium halodurans]MED4083152.1 nickel ABC transporter permease subunit NikC [Halalkalibacterium halodurans]MED4085983.1 nickel ABC transporter permease subunit NikC [Halalkalibacterium halodurans]MED4104294.1 nickel ABC transporter permease subunit NikC [Halalkalibacterium halodurans]MED4110250.1 nickel ABC transporter permease subunit NikC [Halalkalibacterium halodurans]MED4150591.1 nickel ABC transporter permease subunit NikC [Hala
MISSMQIALKSQKTVVVCSVILFVFFLVAILAPWIAPHDPIQVNLALKLLPPSWEYPLGTDQLGRCNLSRLLFGARVSLGFATLIFISSLGIGLLVGAIAGYRGGWIDSVLMRFCEGVMAFPNLVLVLGLVGLFGPGLWQVVLALVMVQWVYYARMFRSMIVSLKEQNFITAARISGSSPWKIIRRHIIPNVLPPIVVIGTLEMGWAIMDISALSFLGLGIQPPTPEWGAMIHEGKSFIRSHPELMLYPGIMILLVVMTFNVLGESLSGRFGIKRRF